MNVKQLLKKIFRADDNLAPRRQWIEDTLRSMPSGWTLLDAGAGQLQNKPLCAHLKYVSQDICQYEGAGPDVGLHTGTWDTKGIDIVCDIAKMPVEDGSFDIVLCSEVLEHVADPVQVLTELARVTKPGGKLVLTAPFASLVHFAPYHFSSGFGRYWYEHHLKVLGFKIERLERNGGWYDFVWQELLRVNSMIDRKRIFLRGAVGVYTILGLPLFLLMRSEDDKELCTFGWHCVAVKE
jgi:SAM-dependent methyltransferase